MAKYNVSVEIASNITLHATLIPGSSASLEHPGDPPEVVDSRLRPTTRRGSGVSVESGEGSGSASAIGSRGGSGFLIGSGSAFTTSV